jgi:hypothetical protein
VKRPKLRWMEDAENDLQKVKVKCETDKPNSREDWTSATKPRFLGEHRAN